MKNFLLLLTSIVLCTVTACNKQNNPGPNNSLVGKWRWVKSIGGIGGTTTTPETAGYTFRDEFYADSTFKRFHNDSLVINSPFRTTKDYKTNPSKPLDILLLTSPNLFSSPTSYFIRNDSLYLGDIQIADGYNTVYVRIK